MKPERSFTIMVGNAVSFLVVEDDEIVRRLLVRELSHHGHVNSVGTSAAARMALQARPFDAMIVDVFLTDGSGLDLIPLARERSPAICVLVLSGATDHDVITRSHELGARYLLKPVDSKQLVVLTEEVLDRRNARARRTSLVLERWAADYDLQPADVELLTLGMDGTTRRAIAAELGVTLATLRTKIRVLVRKTGHDSFEAAVNGLLREALAEPT